MLYLDFTRVLTRLAEYCDTGRHLSSTVLVPTYHVIKVIKGYVCLCSSMIHEDEMHLLKCAYMMICEDNLVLYLYILIQYLMISDDDAVNCLMSNSQNVPKFWKRLPHSRFVSCRA